MAEYFKGRELRHLTETEVAMNATILERLAGEMGVFHVKRDCHDFGVATRTTQKSFAVFIQLHGDKGEVELFTSWLDAAAAGWQVD